MFLDRDGTLIEDTGFIRDPALVKMVSGAAAAMRALRDAGYALVVISNQSGVGRGIITPDEAEAVHRRFVEMFEAEGIVFDDCRYCPHHPDAGCECRKPSPTMLVDAARALDIDLASSFMAGDRMGDVLAGKNAGCTGILITNPGHPNTTSVQPDFESASWDDILAFILGTEGAPA